MKKKLLLACILFIGTLPSSASSYLEGKSSGIIKQAKSLLYFNKNSYISHRRHQANVAYKNAPNGKNFGMFFSAFIERYRTQADFHCRFPAMAYFLANTLGIESKITNGLCNPLATVPIYSSPDKITLGPSYAKLDPNRIYEIHILQATPSNASDNPAGTFGHLMLRLIVCSPKRKTLSPACLHDIEHHLVAGFQADTNNKSPSVLKGLNGSYRSKLLIQRFLETVDRYTVFEDRELRSYPIDLTRIDKEMLIKRMIEIIYLYQANYYYFRRNCVTELKDLFKAVSNDLAMHKIQSIRPDDLLKELLRNGFISSISQKEDAKRLGYLWLNASQDTIRSWAKIKELMPELSIKSYREYDRLALGKRQPLIESQFAKLTSENKKTAANLFFRIEILRSKRFFINKTIYILENYQDKLHFPTLFQQQSSLDPMLGLPTQEEFDTSLKSVTAPCDQDLEAKSQTIQQLLAKDRPDLVQGFLESAQIRRLLKNEM